MLPNILGSLGKNLRFLKHKPFMSYTLKNYLRRYRRRAGLTQEEMAYLLGSEKCAGKISLYESFSQEPSLQAALAYEAIFNVPVSELFEGMSEQAEDPINTRIRSLIQKIEETEKSGKNSYKLSARNAYKLTVLKDLASRSTTEPQKA